MSNYRGFLVLIIGTVVVLGAFLSFVAAGWPGKHNSCLDETPNSCYCEAFNRADVLNGAVEVVKGGVRQPVNTWFNLYSLITSLIVACVVWWDRKADRGPNPIRSNSWLPDLYIFAVLFLGLGSMWFHGSMKDWAGVIDQFSMFVYAAYLVFYTIHRLWDSELIFWILYPITVVLFTVTAALWQWQYTSLILILILVAAYLFFEIWTWVRTRKFAGCTAGSITLWLSAVAFIGFATLAWTQSQTGKPWCDSHSAFQAHGMIWHPFAGIMAVLLYFYWRTVGTAWRDSV